MIIRKYNINDTKALVEIFYRSIHETNKKDYTPEELEAWAPGKQYTDSDYEREITRWKGENINTFVAENNGEVLGFAELEEGGHINSFFVHPEHQGKGAGRMLLKACLDMAKKIGYTKVIAEVSITAQSFFIREGFQTVEPIICDIGGLDVKFYSMFIIL